MEVNKKKIPFLKLNCKETFEQLTNNEKLYAYYLYKACWAGCPIVLFQVSYESPALFVIFQTFFASFKPLRELKNKIQNEDQFNAFMTFASKFYANMGNYSAFGATKFIPELPKEKFEEILKLSTNYNEISQLWNKVKDIVYNDSKSSQTINLEENGGKNNYYLGGIKEEEIKKIDNILQSKKISELNTRLIKINDTKRAVLIGSIDEKKESIGKDDELLLIYGEFSSLLKKVNIHLEKAKKYCLNELEGKMLDDYIESFKTGSIEKHKDSQREWVQDKSPVVEMNIGWIETYIDPLGMRAYYEGWVALKDKEKSMKFGNLVANAEQLLPKLPWEMKFEKDKFASPDFVALDVLCFATKGCPIGINVPNYLDIHEEFGFKNISLSNAYPSFKKENLIFCNDKDVDILVAHGKDSSVLKTACHELLGHGSGKLLRKNDDGTYNFDIDNLINPLTKEKITKYYKGNETFEQKFTSLGRSMEECRADLTGIYFAFEKKVHEIFQINEANFEDVIYSMWLIHIRKGVIGLPLYNEDTKKWGQAHTQGAWVFTSFILGEQKKDKEILKINLDEKKNTFSINLNRENLFAYGRELVSEMLLKLHIWKCTADFESAKEFYDKYSKVDEYFLKIRKIINDNKVPRRLELNCNLTLNEKDNTVSMVEYSESFDGLIESFVDRYDKEIVKDVYDQWVKFDNKKLFE